ncbi:hypothetical protein [Ideonella paludis]|uniref:HEAT repeat domain-containing protein n=1 Tax=Ideonella paludis TaxID=1233411 RepID=A0ABS5DYC7_9BURK|nr:hypothetical protein [Ideonella paludis]MBQ0936152.1 hypothetical protein [Ideonella paludis]
MRKIGSAILVRQRTREPARTVEVIALDEAGSEANAAAEQCLVHVRSGPQESTLTVLPCSQAEALRRALNYIQRRLAAGEQLLSHDGLPGLEALQAAVPAPAAPAPSTAPPALAPAIAALVARFQPDAWKLQSPERRSRSAWRVGECSDATAPDSPTQQALRGLAPRLVALLGTGNDLLDGSLAVALGRLGDPGAAEALQHLSVQARSPATRRIARQAWLMLLSPEARAAQVADTLPGWAAPLASERGGHELVAEVQAALQQHGRDWASLLQDWYERAWVQAAPRAVLLRLLQALPLEGACFQGVRYVYKAAELRRDAEVLGLLHARFENAMAAPLPEARSGAPRAFGPRTRDYLRLRGWRSIRRLAALSHPHAADLAVEMLLGLVDDEQPPPREEQRWVLVEQRYQRSVRLHHRGAGWMLVPKLLLARWPALQTSARAKRWWTLQPLDTTQALPERTEALQDLWDAHPNALLRLAMESRSALVQAVVARALQDHVDVLEAQAPAVLKRLLQSPYAPTAALGFATARAKVEGSTDIAQQIPWLKLLSGSAHAPAQDFALLHLAGNPAAFAQHADLVLALLFSAQERARRQGHGLALLATPDALLAELQDTLLALDPADPGLAEGAALAEQLLQGPLKAAAAAWPGLASVFTLLDHPAVPVLNLAVTWVLLHPNGLALMPPLLLTRLMRAESAERRACGARLLAALPDALLSQQVELLTALALSEHAAIRAAIAPALLRLARKDDTLGRALAARLHDSLFQTERGDDLHEDVLRWLTGELAAFAPAREASGTWRALQARSRGAQRYGAWALAALAPADFSLRQMATLARHADAEVRQWSLRAIDHTLVAPISPQQAADLLPLADTGFDDSRHYAQQLFGERLPDDALEVDLLIAWVDHPQAWVQALGRSQLVRRMSAADASLCLTRLSQHPSTEVQLFVTQWLLDLPSSDAPALARQLRTLTPYLLTVLSQVHRGRVAKARITRFLRAHIEAPETAVVVAEIFARQVVSASLTDKPQYIAGLRDIAARHPSIELPFLSWKTPALHRP